MPPTAPRALLVSCLLAVPGCSVYDESLLLAAADSVEDVTDSSDETPPPDAGPPDGERDRDAPDASASTLPDAGGGSPADGATPRDGSTTRLDATDAADPADVARTPEAAVCGKDAGCGCDGLCPSCSDGVMNGNETGIDCGGDCPANRCGNGSPCTLSTTCASGNCASRVCAADLAVSFFGDQAMSFRRPVADDFTIELWIKTTQDARGTNWWNGGYLFQADVTSANNDFGTSVLNGRFAFGTGNPDVTVVSNAIVNTGSWVHVAATRVRATGVISVFVNGALDKSAATGNTASLTALATAYIGSDRLSALGYVGDIDEIRAWSVARTAAEITATMKKRLTGTETNLVGYWRLDETSGGTFVDLSRSRNDGDWANATEPTRIPSGVPMTPSP